MEKRTYRVRRAELPGDLQAIRRVREPVLILEQGVPRELEWDGADVGCIHVIAQDAHGVPIGTGRLAPDGKIGRMAVVRTWRQQGVGSAVLGRLIDEALACGLTECHLHAQTSVLDFYLRQGFLAEGSSFEEAGIVHRRMRRCLR